MDHFERLVQMYNKAPIHDFYRNIQLTVNEKSSKIELPIDERYFHAAMSTHGSVYFKLLDDAAFFACQSQIKDFFIVTTSFSVQLLRPITKGRIYAEGKLEFQSRQMLTATSQLYDEKGRLCGSGQGQFLKSKLALESVEGYK